MNRPRILIFTAYYKPGFKGGGPIKSIYNIVNSLNDVFDFDIVTLDRDLNDLKPYKNIKQNDWNILNDSIRVYYYSPDKMKLKTFFKILRNGNYNIIYLNSLYNKQTIYVTLLNKLKLISSSILIAPRGEVESGAISIKKKKKLLFLKINSVINMYKNISWHATNFQEKKDIKKYITTDKIYVAENISDTPLINKKTITKNFGTLKAVFISRISPKKNLLLSIKALEGVQGNVVFDVYGPVEDINYYNACKNYAKTLPHNISVNFKGEVHPTSVAETLSKYHFFMFPTLGENYGHVIYEALNSGVPIITTKNVPENDLKERGLGFNISYSVEKWTKIIQYCVNLNQSEYNLYKKNLIYNNQSIINAREKNIKDTKTIFIDIIQSYKDKQNKNLS